MSSIVLVSFIRLLAMHADGKFDLGEKEEEFMKRFTRQFSIAFLEILSAVGAGVIARAVSA